MKCGIVDVGSNTMRLSIYHWEDDRQFKLLMHKKEMAGLASYIQDGVLSDSGILVACRVLAGFKALLDNLDVDRMYVFGTAPLRNIVNTEDALETIRAITGVEVEVLTGAQEADFSFLGATYGGGAPGSGLVADIGGGSTELVAYTDRRITSKCSLPMGSLSLYAKYVEGLFPTKKERGTIRQQVELELERGERTLKLSVQPTCSAEGQWLLGMWLRDGVTGIGTVTFQDPESGVYGALGHSICDSDSGVLLPIDQGSICDAQIIGINPGAAGSPGELNGCADMGKALGSIELNTDCGIFGESYGVLGSRKIESGAMATGPATMISTLSGRVTGEYEVEINRIYRDGGGEHALISVTDPQLLEKTGGIVQGMSGSPLIQNGKLIGAVTHVFVRL